MSPLCVAARHTIYSIKDSHLCHTSHIIILYRTVKTFSQEQLSFNTQRSLPVNDGLLMNQGYQLLNFYLAQFRVGLDGDHEKYTNAVVFFFFLFSSLMYP